MASHQQPFRLMHLPREIRNLIYQHMLCPSGYDRHEYTLPSPLSQLLRQKPQSPDEINQISHSINNAILRASRTVYAEAYEIMVKTNRFIRIQSNSSGFSWFLVTSQLPVLTLDRGKTAQFRGYVMNVQMNTADVIEADKFGALFDFMILANDWDAFCRIYRRMRSMKNAGWAQKMNVRRKPEKHTPLRLVFDPCSLGRKKNQGVIIPKDFLAKTQAEFLDTFQNRVRYLHSLSITSPQNTTPSSNDYKALRERVALVPWQDFPKWISSLEARCTAAEQLRTQGHALKAVEILYDIRITLHETPNHDEVSLIKLHFRLAMNMAHCYAVYVKSPPSDFDTVALRRLVVSASQVVQLAVDKHAVLQDFPDPPGPDALAVLSGIIDLGQSHHLPLEQCCCGLQRVLSEGGYCVICVDPSPYS
ncbi:hypothetical protein FB567DRAFT_189732 [Paraphoma chrysanthemicola]|uniref:Uncharacterized protein n=1 Tax=Paraphoma chrysanthemicola TaxID=798071 RepID=A0A8K0QVN3_9PLEO|nr:hypothetical protein FB567DRAFT_189732 [Paraphoma chrysanthemicola]